MISVNTAIALALAHPIKRTSVFLHLDSPVCHSCPSVIQKEQYGGVDKNRNRRELGARVDPLSDPEVAPLGDPGLDPLGDPKMVPLGDPRLDPLSDHDLDPLGDP